MGFDGNGRYANRMGFDGNGRLAAVAGCAAVYPAGATYPPSLPSPAMALRSAASIPLHRGSGFSQNPGTHPPRSVNGALRR